jgi:succinate dehydrogenase / fumarate reductase, cytochrome b subunit
MAIARENYFWHKLHSLTGVVPIGFYMIQHLLVNSFSIAGPAAYEGVVTFFAGVPWHVLIFLEIFVIALPLTFHAVYGIFITARAENNYFTRKYKWSQNRMYLFQRVTGIIAFFFIIFHVIDTTGRVKLHGHEAISYAAWYEKLTGGYYIMLLIYMIGVLASSYHLAYGLWNFCIRWGITVSQRSQETMQKISLVLFIVVTLLGWVALYGFVRGDHRGGGVRVEQQAQPDSIALARQ